ncbi:MAG TPA: DUF5808 domain-containing protein [Nitrolancea sp.]|nr:DUF5808 domain-containing protein [Nitrolancea sp.]
MNRLSRLVRNIGFLLLGAAIVDQVRRPADERTWTGQISIFPYDLRMPTLARLRERYWNPDDERIFTPQFFGVGWSINVAQILKRAGLL